MNVDKGRGRLLSPFVVGALLLLISAGSFTVRTFQFRNLPAGERVIISDPDSLYHLRLTKAVAESFPRVPHFDWHLNYPAGGEIPLPPLQDLLCSAVFLLIPDAFDWSLEAICFFYSAVMGTLTPLLVFVLSRLLGLGVWPSLLAAALAPWIPTHIEYTTAGRYDHHSGDIAWSLLVFISLMAMWRTGDVSFRRSGPLISTAGAAVAIAASLLNFLGGLLHLAFAAGSIFLGALLLGIRGKELYGLSRRMAAACFGASLIVGLFILSEYGLERLAMTTYDLISGFHPLALSSVAIVLALFALLPRQGEALRLHRFWILALFLLATGVLLAGPISEGIRRYFVGRSSIMLAVVENMSPFLSSSGFRLEGLSFRRGAAALTYAYLAVPVAVLWILHREIRTTAGSGFPGLFLAAWSAVYTILACLQYRYGPNFAAPAAIAVAWLAARLWSEFRDPARGLPARLAIIIALLMLFASFFPGFYQLRYKQENPYYQVHNSDLRLPMEWLRQNTPDPGDGFDPSLQPDYGVMAFWDIGYNVIAQGGRPCIATGYLDSFSGDLFQQSLSFFQESSVEKALQIMERNNLRYLVLRNNPSTSTKIKLLEGALTGTAEPGGGESPSVAERLWTLNGSAYTRDGTNVPATANFRLLREDYFIHPTQKTLDTTKIFELVSGARLTGTAPGGSTVVASIDLKTNFGLRFTYQDLARADRRGFFTLLAPYASGTMNGSIQALGPWVLSVYPDGPRREAAVAERDVLEGRSIRTNLVGNASPRDSTPVHTSP